MFSRSPSSTHRSTPRRFVVTALLLAMVAVGCSSTSGPNAGVAVVGGTTIDEASVIALAGLTDHKGSVSAAGYRDALSLLIVQQALVNAAKADFGFQELTSQADIDALLATLTPEEQAGVQEAIDTGIAAGRNREATEHYVYTQQALATKVSAAILSDQDLLTSVYNDNPELLITVCASHILVATEAEALDVLARLDDGEEFADIAADVSLDQQSPGGVLPCPVSVYSFGQDFAPALQESPIGEISGPVATQFGFHVIWIESRDQPDSFEEFVADPGKWLPPTVLNTELNSWHNNAIAQAGITVQSRIGTWNPSALAITPPPSSP